jgi:hypothetical protein
MDNHGRFYEVQKSASQRGGLLGTWKCFSPTAEQGTAFAYLFLRERLGGRRRKKLLNEKALRSNDTSS